MLKFSKFIADAQSTPYRSTHIGDYAWGLRSPWRDVIDQQGRYWIGDVGAAKDEEINTAAQEPCIIAACRG